ncbi:MAG: hypothetical protein NDI60_01200 [Elusimicrobiales bacterium]|nr:hypothetical protein [Elusimicrobiales bacterium]
MDKLFDNAVFMRHALDALPAIVLVTDEDVRILYRNKAGRDILKGEKIYTKRAGDVMHCLHAEDAPGGCGTGPHCADCVLRNSVSRAFAGKAVRREPTDISFVSGGKTSVVRGLISASPFSFEGALYALLVIENMTELAGLRHLLPICSSCKKIRAEDGSWEKIETYIRRTVPQADLSHGLCPACARKFYPGYSD